MALRVVSLGAAPQRCVPQFGIKLLQRQAANDLVSQERLLIA